MCATAVPRLGMLLVVLLLATSCRTTPDPLARFWGEEHSEQGGLTADQLRARLTEFTFQFSGALQQAGERQTRDNDSIDVRRRSLLWRSAMIPALRRATALDNPIEAYIDTWTLCVQQRLALEDDQLFDVDPTIALDAARALETDIERIGAAFMNRADLDRLKEDVEEFAQEHPLSAGWGRQGNLPSSANDEELEWIIGNPLSAVNPFGGLNTGAQALFEFNQVADDFKTLAEHMPEELSWRIDLALLDLEQRGRVREFNDSLAGISSAAVSMSETADRLPDETRAVISHALDGIEEQYEPLHALLAESRATMTELNGTIDRANDLWESIAPSLDSGDDDVDPNAPSWAEEVEVAARSITVAVAEARELLADVDQLSASKQGEAVVQAATVASKDTIDHAAWRAFQLVLAILAAMVVHQLVKWRLHRSN